MHDLTDEAIREELEELNQAIGNGCGNARQRERWAALEGEMKRRGIGAFAARRLAKERA